MLQLRQLKIFLAAAETLSFTQAAKRIHLSQPSVTEQIRALEESVGRPLFVRQNNVLRLTPAGERLASRARELLAMADDTLRAVQDDLAAAAGAIQVAAPQTLCNCLLLPLLGGYLATCPDVRIDIQERHSAATVQAVRDGTAHFGLIHGWPDDATLQAVLIARDSPVVLLPAGHPLASRDAIGPDALAAFPLVVTAEGCRYRQYAEILLQEASVRPRVCAVADSVPTVRRLVSQGLGLAILPRMAAGTEGPDAAIAVRPIATAGAGLPICLLTRDREVAPHVAAFIALLRSAIDEPVPTLDVQHRTRRVTVAE